MIKLTKFRTCSIFLFSFCVCNPTFFIYVPKMLIVITVFKNKWAIVVKDCVTQSIISTEKLYQSSNHITQVSNRIAQAIVSPKQSYDPRNRITQITMSPKQTCRRKQPCNHLAMRLSDPSSKLYKTTHSDRFTIVISTRWPFESKLVKTLLSRKFLQTFISLKSR